jgi:hypothetical protein
MTRAAMLAGGRAQVNSREASLAVRNWFGAS